MVSSTIPIKMILFMVIIFSVNANTSKDRIISGRKADVEEFPYQVSIQLLLFPIPLCGGSIIHKYIILTAAHCVAEMENPGTLMVRTGTSVATEGGSIHKVRAWKVHQHYDADTSAHDIALILLKSPIKFSAAQNLVKLAEKSPLQNVLGWVTGYGLTNANSDVFFEPQLMAVEIPVMKLDKCKQVLAAKRVIVTDDMICAGGGSEQSNNKDACQGDSGGPFVVSGHQVGVVSWGIGCGTKNLPGVYTNVAMHRNWINEHKNKLLKLVYPTLTMWVNDKLVD